MQIPLLLLLLLLLRVKLCVKPPNNILITSSITRMIWERRVVVVQLRHGEGDTIDKLILDRDWDRLRV